MKAQELLLLYAAGEREFCNRDLRGQNFKNCDLSGANFSHTEIQGANFTYANLQGSKFIGARAGQLIFWKVTLIIVLLLTAFFSGFFSAYAILAAASNLGSSYIQKVTIFPGLISLVMAIIYVAIRLNQRKNTFTSIPASVRRIFILMAEGMGALIGAVAAVSALVGFNLIIIVIAAFIVGSLTVSLALALQLTMIPVRIIFGRKLSFIVPFSLITGSILGSIYQQGSFGTITLTVGLVTLGMLVEAFWVTHRVIAEDPDLALTRTVSIAIASLGGTTFQEANLTNAIFTTAKLKSCNFIKAKLTGVSWHNAQLLNYARLEESYLESPKTRKLAVARQGSGEKFNGLNLEGIDLQGANLQDASFIGANLNQSNLRGADFSRAILKQTQLEGADLTGATLTGAYIEDWGITATTKLENVQCEYVFMRSPTKENPNPLRKPDNLRQTFAEGEFADFIQPFFDTLDLYHSQDVDPRAISIALKNLSVNHPDDDIQFVAIERRGNNGLNLRFTTAPGADKSELSHEYFDGYDQVKKKLPIAAQIKLAEQDVEIRTLKGTIEQFIQIGTHHSTVQADTIQVIQGELIVTENRGININAGGNIGNVSGLVGGDGVVNLGTINGNVTNAINQLADAPELNQPNLKTLLTQLQQAIQADTTLSDPDKADLLEQVQTLAEAKQVEEPVKREGITRKAMKMFDATLKNLPETAKLAEACSKLLPLIFKVLGFPL